MVLVLVEGADALAVDNEYLVRPLLLAVYSLECNWLTPDPQAFGAWIYSRANAKTRILARFVEQNAIE